jgi:hypothetical protein
MDDLDAGPPAMTLLSRVIQRIIRFFLQIIQQIDKIRIVEFKPLRDCRGETAASARQRIEHFVFQIGIENFPDANHYFPFVHGRIRGLRGL